MKIETEELIQVQPEWDVAAARIAALPRHKYQSSSTRMITGLVAEQAAIEYLLRLDDAAVTWLAAESMPRSVGFALGSPAPRPHLGDLKWRGHELDVKLVSKYSKALAIKVGAQHLHHLFLEWFKPPMIGETRCAGAIFRVLGVVLRNQPETFEPAGPLSTSSGVIFTNAGNGTREVHGWWVPRDRIRPARILLDRDQEVA